MAIHITPVASRSPLVPEAAIRRPAAVRTAAGQLAAEVTSAALAHPLASNFDSVLALNAPATKPVAAAATWLAKRSSAAETPATASAAVAATVTAAPSPSTVSASGLSDFELLFGGSSYNPANPMVAAAAPTSSASAPAAPPTAQSVFGPNPWMTDPIGLNPDGTSFGYNPFYFATESTAQTVAQMIGGKVITEDVFTQPAGQDPFVQQQPNYMVQMPNGAVINPGLVASFYTFGFSQSRINTMIAQEVANTPPPAQTT